MEIKIKADDMFEILVEQGIEEVHAKAIIFDLLYVGEKGEDKRHIPRTSVRSHPRVRHPEPVISEDKIASDEALEAIDEYEEPPRKTLGSSRRVSGDRPDFSKFGGPAQSPSYVGNK